VPQTRITTAMRQIYVFGATSIELLAEREKEIHSLREREGLQGGEKQTHFSSLDLYSSGLICIRELFESKLFTWRKFWNSQMDWHSDRTVGAFGASSRYEKSNRKYSDNKKGTAFLCGNRMVNQGESTRVIICY